MKKGIDFFDKNIQDGKTNKRRNLIQYSNPGSSKPKKGDIIVFEYPGDRDVIQPTEILNYVKRCVGEPGDTIEIKNKVVYINGEELHRPPHIQYVMPKILPTSYTRPDIFPKGSKWNKDQYGPLIIPKEGDVVELNLDNIETYKKTLNEKWSELPQFLVSSSKSNMGKDGILELIENTNQLFQQAP